MDKKIGLFWLRDDFRLSKNNGLIEATINHERGSSFLLIQKKYLSAAKKHKNGG